MNRTTMTKHAKRLALGLAALALAATPSFAQTYDLCATTGSVTMPDPDSTVVPIWGYVAGDCTGTSGTATLLAPVLRGTVGTPLTITLYNDLAVNVSFFVPGYRAVTTGGSAGLLTAEVAPGGNASYALTARAGTYLYHSGTDMRTQVPMGLYGALVVDQASGQAYTGVAYDQDEVLVYSQIDPNLNADPENFGGARVADVVEDLVPGWNPQYYLINGVAHPDTPDFTINTSEDVLLRFVNAGLRTFFPTLDGGLYMHLKAEDGNRYPQPLEQYGIELQAGKTIDAMINAGSDGSYALYDRGASYDGGVAHVIAGAVAGAPTAFDDAYSVNEDTVLTANGVAPNQDGVLVNDTGGAAAAVLVSDVSAGALVLAAGGTFSYTPNANFNGIDTFHYKANDGLGGPYSNVATVTITVDPVNDGPTAVADSYDAVEGQMLNVAAPGVLDNDEDIDGDGLTAENASAPVVTVDVGAVATGPGIVTLNLNGSFTHDPTAETGLDAGDQVTFTYDACDAEPLCSSATVTITVVAPADNIPPFANDDFATVDRNSIDNLIDLRNDVDADGTVDYSTVFITTGANTQRGGTVASNGDGFVTYTPKRGMRGTDTFQYTVKDNDGAISNVATVRVNVVRP